VIIIGNASLYFGTVDEEFPRAPFFSWFFVARANQKNRILALGDASTKRLYCTLCNTVGGNS
jgi:hypothetical protein